MAFYRAKRASGGGTLKTEQIKNGTAYFTSRTQYSVNVANELPNDYQNLTLDNFSVEDVGSFQATTSTPGTSDASLFLSYDNTTGVLSVGRKTSRQSIGGTYYYLSLNYYIKVSYI